MIKRRQQQYIDSSEFASYREKLNKNKLVFELCKNKSILVGMEDSTAIVIQNSKIRKVALFKKQYKNVFDKDLSLMIF